MNFQGNGKFINLLRFAPKPFKFYFKTRLGSNAGVVTLKLFPKLISLEMSLNWDLEIAIGTNLAGKILSCSEKRKCFPNSTQLK